MNNLKFRAWDKVLKVMSEIIRIDLLKKEIIHYETNNCCYKEINVNFNNYIIMQSTGFKDKNGKEIFIGDIVKFPDEYEFVDGAGETTDVTVCNGFNIASVVKKGSYITLDNFVYEYEITETELDNHECTFDDLDFKNFEIIGNIYENKELIKNEQS